LYFRKVTQEIFSELDEIKAEVPNYLTRRWNPKESPRRQLLLEENIVVVF
jgi:hypothetical protein